MMCLELLALAVDKPSQRCGHGTLVLMALKLMARQLGLQRVFVCAVDTERVLRYYRRARFTPCKLSHLQRVYYEPSFVPTGGTKLHKWDCSDLVSPVPPVASSSTSARMAEESDPGGRGPAGFTS